MHQVHWILEEPVESIHRDRNEMGCARTEESLPLLKALSFTVAQKKTPNFNIYIYFLQLKKLKYILYK